MNLQDTENLDLNSKIRFYRSLKYVRRVEEEIARIYPSDKIKSPVHLSIGQEFATVGVSEALKDNDVCACSYRSHAVYLARGGSLEAMFAEMFGKADGCAAGKGGSMHLVAPEAHVIGASAVVGTHIPLAAGHALAMKGENAGRVAVCFFGDGATEEGCFYETVNFASLHKLPMVLICENNFYAIHEPLSKRWAKDALVERMETFDLHAERVTDGDIFSVNAAAVRAIDHARGGKGPALVEIHTYRWREHVGPNEDYDAGYRPRDEAERWMANDQVGKLAEMIPADLRDPIDAEIEQKIAAAIQFAEDSPFPGEQELMKNVYA